MLITIGNVFELFTVLVFGFYMGKTDSYKIKY
jgi:hypothetical protein